MQRDEQVLDLPLPSRSSSWGTLGDFSLLYPEVHSRHAGTSPLTGRAVSKHQHVLMRGKLLSHKSATRSGQRQSSHRPQELQELSPFCLQHWKRDLTSMQCYKGIAQPWHYPTQSTEAQTVHIWKCFACSKYKRRFSFYVRVLLFRKSQLNNLSGKPVM